MKILLATAQPNEQYALSQVIQQCCPFSVQLTCLPWATENAAAEIRSADLVFIDTQWMEAHTDALLRSGYAYSPHLVLIIRNDIAAPAWLGVLHRCICPPFTPEDIMPAIWRRKEEMQQEEESIRNRMAKEMARFKDEPSFADQRLVFSNQEEIVFISPLDLTRIEAKGNCSMIYALGYAAAFCVSTNLGELHQRFEGLPFLFQPHRSHLVNLYHVKKLTRQRGGALLVRSHNGGADALIPLSQPRREDLMEKMSLLGQELPLLRRA
jgi:DNA-binding LytR/AlgR family response regulator